MLQLYWLSFFLCINLAFFRTLTGSLVTANNLNPTSSQFHPSQTLNILVASSVSSHLNFSINSAEIPAYNSTQAHNGLESVNCDEILKTSTIPPNSVYLVNSQFLLQTITYVKCLKGQQSLKALILIDFAHFNMMNKQRIKEEIYNILSIEANGYKINPIIEIFRECNNVLIDNLKVKCKITGRKLPPNPPPPSPSLTLSEDFDLLLTSNSNNVTDAVLTYYQDTRMNASAYYYMTVKLYNYTVNTNNSGALSSSCSFYPINQGIIALMSLNTFLNSTTVDILFSLNSYAITPMKDYYTCPKNITLMAQSFLDIQIYYVYYYKVAYNSYTSALTMKIRNSNIAINNFIKEISQNGQITIGIQYTYTSRFISNSKISISFKSWPGNLFTSCLCPSCNTYNLLVGTIVNFIRIGTYADIMSTQYFKIGSLSYDLSGTLISVSYITPSPLSEYFCLSHIFTTNVYVSSVTSLKPSKFSEQCSSAVVISSSIANFTACNQGLYELYNICSQSSECYECINPSVCTKCENQYYMLNSLCVSCSYGCLNCTNSSVCEECLGSYGFMPDAVSCMDCSANCFMCDMNYTKCDQCHSGYGIVRNLYTCALCYSNYCIDCHWADTCLTCDIHYGLNNSSYCEPCLSGCDTCTYISSCDNCQNGYGHVGESGICLPAVANCQWYYYYNICDQCDIGYYVNPNNSSQCLPCYQECIDCDDGSNCLSCVSQQAVPNNYLGCNCSSGYFGQAPLVSLSACAPCFSECLTCDSTGMCIDCVGINAIPLNLSIGCKCNVGYYQNDTLTYSYSCAACNIECASCSSLSKCDTCVSQFAIPAASGSCECVSGYYGVSPLSISSSCMPCFDDCLNCIYYSTCTECKAINAQIDSIGCKCLPGFYNTTYPLATNTSCISCYPECQLCSQEFKCQTCISLYATPDATQGCVCNPGYYGANLTQASSCNSCYPGCSTCNAALVCLTCSDPNSHPNATQGCDCNPGFYYNTSLSLCVSCHINCSTCLTGNTCLTCNDSNAFANQLSLCQCNPGYYSNQTCQPCNSDCYNCSNSTTCLSCLSSFALPVSVGCECIPGYSFDVGSRVCINCWQNCSRCDNNGFCLACKDLNAEVLNGKCQCRSGFYFDTSTQFCKSCIGNCSVCSNNTVCEVCNGLDRYGALCDLCHPSCKSCVGPKEYHCYSCREVLLDGVCLNSCPLGYLFNASNGSCIAVGTDAVIMRLEFKGSGSVFYDSINQLPAFIVGNNTRRQLSTNSPVSTFQQGMYFPGIGSLKMPLSSMAFGNQFTIGTWLNPESPSGTIYTKLCGNNTKISLTLDNLILTSTILLDKTHYSITHPNIISINTWSYALLSVAYNGSTSMKLSVNTVLFGPKSFSSSPYIDCTNSTLYIASSPDSNLNFRGFIFSIEAFSAPLTESSLQVVTNCNGCSICPASATCIPSCTLTQFYSEKSKKCEDCPSYCYFGCKSELSCNLCADSHCVNCRSFSTRACTICELGYEVVNSTCSQCATGTYYNSINKTCSSCPYPCSACVAADQCSDCFANSSLVDNKMCVCDPGFVLTDVCERKSFSVAIIISKTNVIELFFEEPLLVPLNQSDFQVLVNENPVFFELKENNLADYIVSPIYPIIISTGSIVKIVFKSKLMAAGSLELSNTEVTATLFSSDAVQAQKQLEAKVSNAKTLASQGTTTCAAVTVGASLFNFNPSSFFSFLSTAEMFYSIYLFNISLHPVLSEFLVNSRVQNSVTNIFSYMVDETSGAEIPDKYKSYGYSSNLFVINAGVQISSLILSLISFLGLLAITRIRWFKIKLAKVLQGFIFGVFLRFWVQTFFELLTATTVGFQYTRYENSTQIGDFVFSLIVFAAEVFCAGFMMYLVRRRCLIYDKERIEEFMKYYGTFFEEFKEIGRRNWAFYVFYVARRIMLVISYLFIKDGPLQLATSIGFSLAIPLYILVTGCFNSRVQNIYNFFNELTVSVYHIILLFSLMNADIISSEKAADLCINCITAAWAMNFAASLYTSIEEWAGRIRRCLRRRRERLQTQVSAIYEVKTSPEFNDDEKEKTIAY